MRRISCKHLGSFGEALGTDRKQFLLQKTMSSFHETLERSRFSFWQNCESVVTQPETLNWV